MLSRSPLGSVPSETPAGADTDTSTARLVTGMASDAKRLGEAYVELLWLEAVRSLRKAASALLGAAIFAVGVPFLLFGGALVLSDETPLSRGASFLLVGALVCVAGLASFLIMRARTAREEQ